MLIISPILINFVSTTTITIIAIITINNPALQIQSAKLITWRIQRGRAQVRRREPQDLLVGTVDWSGLPPSFQGQPSILLQLEKIRTLKETECRSVVLSWIRIIWCYGEYHVSCRKDLIGRRRKLLPHETRWEEPRGVVVEVIYGDLYACCCW